MLACKTDFSYSSHHRAKTIVHHKFFCKHNFSDQTGTSWITASGTQKHSYQVGIPRTQSSSPKSWQGSVLKIIFSLEYAGFEQLCPAELTLPCVADCSSLYKIYFFFLKWNFVTEISENKETTLETLLR